MKPMREGWTVKGTGDYDLIEQIDGVEDSIMHVIFSCYPVSHVSVYLPRITVVLYLYIS